MDRLDEFCTYHMGCDGECNGTLLAAWADEKKLGIAERFNLSYFYSLVYNVPSAIYMLVEIEGISEDPERWVAVNKDKVIFQSDRRWVSIQKRFNDALEEFATALMDGTDYMRIAVNGDEIDVARAVEETQKWYYFSRFAAYLFVETVSATCHLRQVSNPEFDFEHGDTATSGLMNIYRLDGEADAYDRTGRISPETTGRLSGMLRSVCDEIYRRGGDSSQTCVETSLCAYRKFHKGSRYNGYYLDRQLGELYMYPTMNEGSVGYVNELFDLRSELFPHWMLGEFRNWDGIRKRMKSFYKRNGRVNGRGDA